MTPDSVQEQFMLAKPKLLKIAYNMLGSISDADDIVQEAWLRWMKVDRDHVISCQAFLTTVVTRLCIDQLKSAQTQRQQYIGPWLPEPVLQMETEKGPEHYQELSDSLSYALLALLETLSPPERAVFILRQAFDFRHKEIAETLDISEDNARQLDRRAKQRLNLEKTRFHPNKQEHEQLFRSFVFACAKGDIASLSALLSEHVVAYADGGGKATALLRPIEGRSRVLNYLKRINGQRFSGVRFQLCRFNGELGLAVLEKDHLIDALTIEAIDGQITAIYTVRNPDKLAFI